MPRPLLAVRGAAEFAEADFVPARTEPGPVGGFERFGQVNGMGIRVESRRVAVGLGKPRATGPSAMLRSSVFVSTSIRSGRCTFRGRRSAVRAVT